MVLEIELPDSFHFSYHYMENFCIMLSNGTSTGRLSLSAEGSLFYVLDFAITNESVIEEMEMSISLSKHQSVSESVCLFVP